MVLPRSMRLKGHKCFNHLHKHGIRYQSSLMIIRVAKSKPTLHKFKKSIYATQSFRCAVAISNKVSKKAVVRNRLRRLFHNHLKQKLSILNNHSNNWALISLKPKSLAEDTTFLLNECDRLLHKAGLIL